MRARNRTAQGPLTAAAPANMPTDAYLSTFETNPIASQALFWARLGNWRFCSWRKASDASVRAELAAEDAAEALARVRALRAPCDGDAMDVDAAPAAPTLRAAILEEACVTDADIERCMRAYYARMPPDVPAAVCAACCAFDVPIAPLPAVGDHPAVPARHVPGILQFYGVADIDDGSLDALLYTAAVGPATS